MNESYQTMDEPYQITDESYHSIDEPYQTRDESYEPILPTYPVPIGYTHWAYTTSPFWSIIPPHFNPTIPSSIPISPSIPPNTTTTTTTPIYQTKTRHTAYSENAKTRLSLDPISTTPCMVKKTAVAPIPVLKRDGPNSFRLSFWGDGSGDGPRPEPGPGPLRSSPVVGDTICREISPHTTTAVSRVRHPARPGEVQTAPVPVPIPTPPTLPSQSEKTEMKTDPLSNPVLQPEPVPVPPKNGQKRKTPEGKEAQSKEQIKANKRMKRARYKARKRERKLLGSKV